MIQMFCWMFFESKSKEESNEETPGVCQKNLMQSQELNHNFIEEGTFASLESRVTGHGLFFVDVLCKS